MRAGIFSRPMAAATSRRSCSPRCWRSRRWPGPNLAAEVATERPYVVPAVGERRFTVAAVDLGIKAMTPDADGAARHRGARAARRPTSRRSARSARRGVLLQRPRRPGHRRPRGRAAARRPGRRLPYFGICFGNQILGRALGFGTYKLKYGHRGINQPVMDRTTGKVEVTAHNHGFAVDAPRHDTRDRVRRVGSATSASTTTSSRV
jgi:carbamoyl-phosphate synthase small subunit